MYWLRRVVRCTRLVPTRRCARCSRSWRPTTSAPWSWSTSGAGPPPPPPPPPHPRPERRIRHLPVVVGERLVGIVSIGDVVKAQRDQYEGEIDMLEARVATEHP